MSDRRDFPPRMDENQQVVPEMQLMSDDDSATKEKEVAKVIRLVLITYTIISFWVK